MKNKNHRFRGLYWRQMFITVGMVLLTLLLLGVSFFCLSYNYARNQKSEEINSRAAVMSRLSVSYLESGRYLSIEELQQASGVGSSILDRLRQVGALGDLPESSQVSFF